MFYTFVIYMFYYVVSVCRKTTFMKTYAHIVFPTNDPQLCPLNEKLAVNPPLMRREIGRPKKLRNKTNDEPRNAHVLQRKLATVTCHMCGTMGHNKQSCKENRVVDTKEWQQEQEVQKYPH